MGERQARLASGSVRVVQDGVRDASITHTYRADESGGWVWEASYALESAIVNQIGYAHEDWDGVKILELGAGTGQLAMRLAQRGAYVTATDRAGALPRISRNILRNQQRFGVLPDGDQVLRVEYATLDWEEELQRYERAPATAPLARIGEHTGSVPTYDYIVGSDLVYLHEMHVPLLCTMELLCCAAASIPAKVPMCYLSWEERKPQEEENFLELAKACGFEPELVHKTNSTVSGAPITVHRLRWQGS